MKNVFETTVLSMSGLELKSVAGRAVDNRSNIFNMSDAAEEAVLRPKEYGAFEHGMRAALAARIAFLNHEDALAHKYLEDAGNFKEMANPSYKGETKDLTSILLFMDKVAKDTRNVKAEDIATLKNVHVSDADIVRLAEINSFMAYQIRLIAGLRLMKGDQDG
ncbi:MAG: hypothetical protein P8J85_09430 [Alphaproteobacteria bacterium]|nr:hypothetical protein [Alphaproteobacteria bacterium]MDG1887416.1 hypothetical protein [Alphaproteobacteria bacterium]